MWFRRIFEYCCSYIDYYRAQWPGLPVPSAPGTCLPWANPKSFFNEVQNERVVHDFVSNWTISQSVWIKSWSLKWLTDVVKIAKLILTHAIRLAIWARAVNRNMVVYHFELEIFRLRLDQSSWHLGVKKFRFQSSTHEFTKPVESKRIRCARQFQKIQSNLP